MERKLRRRQGRVEVLHQALYPRRLTYLTRFRFKTDFAGAYAGEREKHIMSNNRTGRFHGPRIDKEVQEC